MFLEGLPFREHRGTGTVKQWLGQNPESCSVPR